MSTEPIASGVTANPLEEGIPFGTRLQELAEQRRDDTAVTIVSLDGTAHSLTFGELDARANQWGRALAANGAETGSLVALAIPNSQHLVLATLGCWKIGAVPIPMHWDLPEWERNRVRAVIDPAVVVDEKWRWELAAQAAGRVRKSSARGRFPHSPWNLQQRVYRRAQGDPQLGAVALDASARRTIFVGVDTGSSAADDHGARADVSHQRLRHFPLPAGR